jgi:hypothetical protein
MRIRFFVARAILRLALCSILPLGFTARAAAQAATGTVEGVARGAGEELLPFSLVRLVPEDAQAPVPQGVITDAEGRFRFAEVPAGEYRLQVEQIGYERIRSPVLRVVPGEALRQDVRGTPAPIRLEALTVTGGRCLTTEQLGDDPELAALWNEARKGVETRRAFELQYRFSRTLSQDIETRWRVRGPSRTHTETPVYSAPDSVVKREQSRRALFRARGYADGNALSVLEEKELLDDEFLRDHCLEPSFQEAEGAFAVRFRPVQPRRTGAAIRGTVWIEAETYRIRRLEFEYLKEGRQFAESRVDYGDVPVDGSVLRLPVGGHASIRLSGTSRALATRATSTFRYLYRDIQPVRAR